MNRKDEFTEWLIWRIDAAAKAREQDFAALSHGGAGFEEGRRAGEEDALRDVLDMVAQTWGINSDAR